MEQEQYFAFGVDAYIDADGVAQSPRIVVSPDARLVQIQATEALANIVDAITGEEHDRNELATDLMARFDDLELMEALDLFDAMEDDRFDDAPKFYLAIGMDEDELDELMTNKVIVPDEDEEDLDDDDED